MSDSCFRLTIDLESHERSIGDEYLRVVEQLLEELATRGIRATFFVNGTAIASEIGKRLVTKISRLSHEIGSHGHQHCPLRLHSPTTFAADIRRSRDELSQIAAKDVVGYRAPYFSLTRKTLWASQVINESGFIYSSSTIPALNPQSGFPGLPRRPFKWQSGLIEFPVPVIGLRQLALPLLGGGYFRLLPKILAPVLRSWQLRSGDTWTYLHPYDLSNSIPVHSETDPTRLMHLLLQVNRTSSLAKYLSLLSATESTFADLANDFTYSRLLKQFVPDDQFVHGIC